MATIGDLWVTLNAKTDNFESGMNKAKTTATNSTQSIKSQVMTLASEYKKTGMTHSDAMKKAWSEVERNTKSGTNSAKNNLNSLNQVVKRVAQNIASFMIYDVGKKLVTGFIDATKAGINYNAMLETSKVSWTNLLGGSEEAANKMLSKLEELAAVTPFDYEGVDKFAKKLELAGLGGKDLEKNIMAVGDAVSAVGGTSETLDGVATALTQMSMKGKVSAEEMQQLAERGIPAYQLLAEGMGVTESELMKLMQSGKVMSDEALPILIGQMEKAFGGSMASQVGTFNAGMSTFQDRIKAVAGHLSKPLFDLFAKGLNTVNPILEQLTKSLSEGGILGAIQQFAPKMMPFIESIIGIFDKLKESVKRILDAIMGFWNEHSDWLMPLIEFVWTFICEFISNTIDAIANIVEAGLGVIDGIINFFQNLFSGNFSACWESIKQIFSNAIKLVWNWMQVQFAVNLPNMIKNFGKNFKLWIDDAWVAVKNFFKNGASNVWSTAKSGFSNVLNSIIQYMKQVPTNVKNFMTDAVNKIKSFNLFQIGKDLIQGLINGIKNMGSNVVGAIGSVVKSGIDAAKKKLGINSPSKVFTQFGKWTGEGLAIGIDSENNRVAKASKGLSNSVIDGYNANLKGIKTNLNNTIDSNKSGVSSGLSLNIENFINNREQDIKELVEEIAFYLKRKNISIGGV